MLKVKNSLGFIFFFVFDWRIFLMYFEREERFLYIIDQIEEEGFFDYENIKIFNFEMVVLKYIEMIYFCIFIIFLIVIVFYKIVVGLVIIIV